MGPASSGPLTESWLGNVFLWGCVTLVPFAVAAWLLRNKSEDPFARVSIAAGPILPALLWMHGVVFHVPSLRAERCRRGSPGSRAPHLVSGSGLLSLVQRQLAGPGHRQRHRVHRYAVSNPPLRRRDPCLPSRGPLAAGHRHHMPRSRARLDEAVSPAGCGRRIHVGTIRALVIPT